MPIPSRCGYTNGILESTIRPGGDGTGPGISSMLAMLNNSLENCLLFSGYALAKEIVTGGACLETSRLLNKVFSKITATGEDEGAVSDLRDVAAFRIFCDFLEEAVQLMDGFKDETNSTEEVIRDLNRFRDDDIPRVL